MSGKNIRHLTFAGLFVVVLVSMLVPAVSHVRLSPHTRALYDFVDSLPPGSRVLVSFDHEASAIHEIDPLSRAVLDHLFARDLKPVGVSLLAEGTVIGWRQLESAARRAGKNYGEDYAFFGFRSQVIAAILGMGESVEQVFPEDYFRTPLDSLPLLRPVETYADFSAVISISDGSTAQHWVEYAGHRYGVPISAAVTAAMATSYDPYVSSGQLRGLVAGLRGAAEYETVQGRTGGGLRGLVAQSSAHLYILLLIVIGNVLYWRKKRA